MSSTLLFRKTPRHGTELAAVGYPLKAIFGRKYYDHDGSCGGDVLTLTSADMPFLEGVVLSVGDEKAKKIVQKIIDLIENGETVDMWFEF